MQNGLGDGYRVISEGLNGRTTVMDDEHCWFCVDGAPGGMNGRRYLLPCLHSHKPIAVVVLALGCNDLKMYFNLDPESVAVGCRLLLRDIKASTAGPNGSAPKIVLLSPPLVKDTGHPGLLAFGPDRERRSRATAAAFVEVAREEQVPLVNLMLLLACQSFFTLGM